MDVLSKLRPGPAASRGAGGGPGGNGVPLARGEATPDSSSPLPMKDDILHTLDSFGNENKENNNNADPLMGRRLSSDNKLDGMLKEPWEDLGSNMSTPASLSHSYSLEWEKLFSRPEMLRHLKTRAADGELRSSRFRSVIWKLFLEVLPSNKDEWISKTAASRAKFEELKNKLIINPRKAVDSVDITLNNPLSQDEESPWNKFFQDNELRLTIKQDVIRTYPRIEFFQSNQLRNLMVNILFIFAKENAELSYRQGMHELLAPLIFVLHCDHQAFLHACEIESVLYSSEATRNLMREVMDPAYLEHDAYTMFCQVMETVEPWYLSRDIFCNPRTGSFRNLELLHATPFSRSQDLNPSNAIVTKLTRIQDYILKKFDPELHQHLERLEIAPQIYGIRWLRLLFGREFPMQDLLMLWDAIFGDGIGFDLVDYIFVAMLLYIRDSLLSSDYATCLTALMKFPAVADVHYFVVKAMWLREPNQQPRPPNYTHQGPIKTSSSMGGSSDGLGVVGTGRSESRTSAATATAKNSGRGPQYSRHTKRGSAMMGGFSSFSRKFSRPRTLNVPKSSSEPMSLQTDISPEPRDNDPIGSTVSLSQVEESMFRNVPSASSLARLDAGSNLRSAQSSPGIHHGSSVFPLTPDDLSVAGSPTKFNTLPGKPRAKQKKLTKMERELQQEVARLQGELHDKENMCRYCSSKLDVHIDRLQQDLSKSEPHIEGEVMVSLAGLKLVRDILSGTLRFTQNITSDEDLAIVDGYYDSQNGGEVETSIGSGDYRKTSLESDILLGASSASSLRDGAPLAQEQRGKLFYMSSEDTASPSEEQFPTGPVRQMSREDTLGVGSDGEMIDVASRSTGTSSNPFHGSLGVTDARNVSGREAVRETAQVSANSTAAPPASSSSSRIKSMFKMSSSSANTASSTRDNTSASSNTNGKHHSLHQQPQLIGGDPLSVTGPQPPPSFSSFESLPVSVARSKGSNPGSLNNSGEYSKPSNNKVSAGKLGPGEYRELASFESKGQRSRAKSDVTGSNSYWPDFLSSNTRLPWYGEGATAESSRGRSQSQPLSARVVEEVVVDEDKDGVNPLYKLRYHDTMEH